MQDNPRKPALNVPPANFRMQSRVQPGRMQVAGWERWESKTGQYTRDNKPDGNICVVPKPAYMVRYRLSEHDAVQSSMATSSKPIETLQTGFWKVSMLHAFHKSGMDRNGKKWVPDSEMLLEPSSAGS